MTTKKENEMDDIARTQVSPKPKNRTNARKRQKERTRQAILESALNCFGDKGFDGTTTRAIADGAGVKKPEYCEIGEDGEAARADKRTDGAENV